MSLPPSSPRRLLFVCESGTDVRLVRGLVSRFDVTLLLRTAFGPTSINFPLEQGTSVRIVNGPPGRASFAAFVLRHLTGSADDYDVVVAQNAGLSAAASNLARRLGKRRPLTLLLICSPNIAYFRCRWRRRQISLPVYAAGLSALELTRVINARLAERYIVLSRYLATTVGSDRTSVIPLYGIDTQRFHPIAPDAKLELRARLQLPPDRYLILFSSRIAPEKDTESLVQACVRLKSQGRAFSLLNLSGGYREFLRLAGTAGLSEFVIGRDAVHPIHELPHYYQAADVCVQASLEEGLGFSPLEALASEVPVIATAVGGLCETIIDGETGLTVPVRSPEKLAAAIGYAMDHPTEMSEMAQRGRRMVQERFEAERVMDEFSVLVESMLRAQAGNTGEGSSNGL